MQLLLLSERHLLVGLDEDEGFEVVDVLDAVLDLGLRHLDQLAVLLLLQHGVHPVGGDPGVLLDLGQSDASLRVLDQHPRHQVLELLGELVRNLEEVFCCDIMLTTLTPLLRPKSDNKK